MAIVLITGANSGFGLEGVLAFARNGDTVYASMRDISKAGPLQLVAEQEDLDIRPVTLDITRPDTFEALLQHVVDDFGRIDVLVNNAGIVRPGALEDLGEDDLRLVMETNLIGPLLLSRAVLPHMRRERSGYIIMMSSLSGIAGLPGELAYTASKFGLEGATESLRHEVDRWGIKVALVEAGMYATRIFDTSLASGSMLPPDYPLDSPYRALIESRLREVQANSHKAFDPRIVGELFTQIAASDGSRLRWQADAVATQVLSTMFAQDDASRDAFLREVAGTDWWSEGKDHAD